MRPDSMGDYHLLYLDDAWVSHQSTGTWRRHGTVQYTHQLQHGMLSPGLSIPIGRGRYSLEFAVECRLLHMRYLNKRRLLLQNLPVLWTYKVRHCLRLAFVVVDTVR